MIGVVSFSLTLPMTRIAVSSLDPFTVAVWRGIFASVMALLILIILRPPLPKLCDLKALSLCSFGIVFGFPVFTTLAMQSISASHGAIVVGLLPLATAMVGVAIGKERPSWGFWLAGLIGTALTITFILKKTEGEFAIGHIYLILAVITAAIGYAYGGQISIKLGGWQTTCWALVMGFPITLVVALFVPMSLAGATLPSFAALLYISLISQLAGFFFWYRGMAMSGIVRVSQLQLTQLFLTLMFSALLLSEHLGRDVLAFGFAVIMVVWIGTRLRIQ